MKILIGLTLFAVCACSSAQALEKDVQTAVCEALTLAKSSTEFLKRVVAKNPIRELSEIQAKGLPLIRETKDVIAEIAQTPFFDQILSEMDSTKKDFKNAMAIVDHRYYRQFLEKARLLMNAKPGTVALIGHIDALLHAQKNYLDWLVNGNLAYVLHVAGKQQANVNLEFDLIISEGLLGLFRAAEMFDPELGWKFSTYADDWVVSTILRENGNFSRMIRVPIHMHDKLRTYSKAKALLAKKLGREPSVAETAKRLKKKLSEVEEFEGYLSQYVDSLDAPLSKADSEGQRMLDIIEDDRAVNSVTDMTSREDIALLKQAMKETLTDQEYSVLAQHFGMDEAGEEKSLVEVGKLQGLTRDKIRRIERLALQKLRTRMVLLRNGHKPLEPAYN